MSEDTTPVKTVAEKLAESKAQKATLDRIEATTGQSGAIPLASKQMLLATTSEEQKDKDKRYRWVNMRNPERVELRKREGYEVVPMTEGGRTVGNLTRMAVPRHVYEARVKEQTKVNKARLNAHKTEVENMAEGVAKELRDRHGIQVRAEDILIKEG